MAVYKLNIPVSEEDVRKLRMNDTIYINGPLVTVRDAAHRRALEHQSEGKKLPISFEGLAIFHCGPVAKKEKNKWKIIAAGPTTSSRMNIFEDEFIKNFKVRIIIGKGGMDSRTADAMKKYGAVYGAFTGGAAVLAAKAIKHVNSVEWIDLGKAEAMWILEVQDFGPLTIAIDAHGNNLYKDIQTRVEKKKPEIYKRMGI